MQNTLLNARNGDRELVIQLVAQPVQCLGPGRSTARGLCGAMGCQAPASASPGKESWPLPGPLTPSGAGPRRKLQSPIHNPRAGAKAIGGAGGAESQVTS